MARFRARRRARLKLSLKHEVNLIQAYLVLAVEAAGCDGVGAHIKAVSDDRIT